MVFSGHVMFGRSCAVWRFCAVSGRVHGLPVRDCSVSEQSHVHTNRRSIMHDRSIGLGLVNSLVENAIFVSI